MKNNSDLFLITTNSDAIRTDGKKVEESCDERLGIFTSETNALDALVQILTKVVETCLPLVDTAEDYSGGVDTKSPTLKASGVWLLNNLKSNIETFKELNEIWLSKEALEFEIFVFLACCKTPNYYLFMCMSWDSIPKPRYFGCRKITLNQNNLINQLKRSKT